MQKLKTLSPVNKLELQLASTRRGETKMSEFLTTLISESVFVPSGTPVERDLGELQPIVYDRAGIEVIAVFSSSAAAATASDMAPFGLEINTRELLKSLSPKTGIVLNPGFDLGLELLPDGIPKLLEDFG